MELHPAVVKVLSTFSIATGVLVREEVPQCEDSMDLAEAYVCGTHPHAGVMCANCFSHQHLFRSHDVGEQMLCDLCRAAPTADVSSIRFQPDEGIRTFRPVPLGPAGSGQIHATYSAPVAVSWQVCLSCRAILNAARPPLPPLTE